MTCLTKGTYHMDRVKRIWYLSPMRAAKVQASLRIQAVSPEPPLLAHTSSESRGTFRQKARLLAPLNGLACAVKICHDRMLEDTNSLDGAHMQSAVYFHSNSMLVFYSFTMSHLGTYILLSTTFQKIVPNRIHQNQNLIFLLQFFNICYLL